MKTLLILKTLIIFSLNAFSQYKEMNSPSLYIVENLKGKVKSLTETTYNATEKFGEAEKISIASKKTFMYNSSAKLVKLQLKDNSFIDFKYNNSTGNTVEKNNYDSNGNLESRTKYNYDKANLVEENKYKSDGSLNFKTKYKYNDNGKLIEVVKYNSDGSRNEKVTLMYNLMGHEIENIYYNSSGSIERKYSFKYDKLGNLVEEKEGAVGSLNMDYASSTKKKYDAAGRVIEIKLENSGLNDHTEKFKYDEEGNIKEVDLYKFDGTYWTKFINIYNYDQNGNWISKIEIRNDKPKYIIERVIEYY